VVATICAGAPNARQVEERRRCLYDIRVSAERDELHRLGEDLSEDEVSEALRAVRGRRNRMARPWPPRWFGAEQSSRTDTAMRSEELLKDGFGRRS
jgi:hypothetical protein